MLLAQLLSLIFMVLILKTCKDNTEDYLSEFKAWNQKSHAKNWLLFPKNIESRLSLDETAFSNGNLYTILTNKKTKGKKGAIIAMAKGTKAEAVIKILHKIPLKQRKK